MSKLEEKVLHQEKVTFKEAFDVLRFCVIFGVFGDEYDEMRLYLKEAGFNLEGYEEKVFYRNNAKYVKDPVRFIDRITIFTVYNGDLPVYKTYDREDAIRHWDEAKEAGVRTYIKCSNGFCIIDTDDLPF